MRHYKNKKKFSFSIHYKMLFIPVMIKLNFQQPLFQSLASHAPSEIILWTLFTRLRWSFNSHKQHTFSILFIYINIYYYFFLANGNAIYIYIYIYGVLSHSLLSKFTQLQRLTLLRNPEMWKRSIMLICCSRNISYYFKQTFHYFCGIWIFSWLYKVWIEIFIFSNIIHVFKIAYT